MKHVKPTNSSKHFLENVKTTYDLKNLYDLLLGKHYDQVKIKLESVMENVVLSNDTTGKSTTAILTEVSNQILALDLESLEGSVLTKDVVKPKILVKKI